MRKHEVTIQLEGNTVEEIAIAFDKAREHTLARVKKIEESDHELLGSLDDLAQRTLDSMTSLPEAVRAKLQAVIDRAKAKHDAAADSCVGTPTESACTDCETGDGPLDVEFPTPHDQQFEKIWQWLEQSPLSNSKIELGIKLMNAQFDYLERRERFEDHKRRMDKSAS